MANLQQHRTSCRTKTHRGDNIGFKADLNIDFYNVVYSRTSSKSVRKPTACDGVS
jgi:hypothetical protein